MKKILLFTIQLFMLNLFINAQTNFSLPADEAVLVYSLPKTELCVEVEIEKSTQKPGAFYRFSERYLAATDVIIAEKTTYSLKSVQIKTRPAADDSRTYMVASSKSFPLNNISVNDKGILCGINVPCKETPEGEAKEPAENAGTNTAYTKPLPLTEEYMLASSTAKMAEGAAKQIYRIRESRLALLTADLDQLPADGEFFNAMLEGMDKMEKELTELFTGTIVNEKQKHTIYLAPSAVMKNEVLFRVSVLKGLVGADDLSGSPYYINVLPKSVETHQPAASGRKSTRPALYSVLPAATQVTVGDGKSIFFTEQFLMPQFGQVIPIPDELLQRKNAKIYIDEQTGRLTRVETP